MTVDNDVAQSTPRACSSRPTAICIVGDALTLSGPQSIIRVGDGTALGAAYTATIAAELTGSGQLVKTDLGTLVLTGTNSYTGGTAINGGMLRIAADANLGAAAGDLSLDGGTLHTTADITSGRSVRSGRHRHVADRYRHDPDAERRFRRSRLATRTATGP